MILYVIVSVLDTDEFTYYANKKRIVASVVDYVCNNSTLLPITRSLELADRKAWSDHFPLVCSLGKIEKEKRRADSVSVPVGRKWYVKGSVFDSAVVNKKLKDSIPLGVVLNKLEALANGDFGVDSRYNAGRIICTFG